MNICIATQNQGKLKEFQYLAEQFCPQLSFYSIKEATQEPVPDVIENGSTFLENASIKAKAYARWLKRPCLSDDSGLMVEALAGEPGLYSARYAGPDATDAENNAKLLQEIKSKQLIEPKAKFVCVLAYFNPLTEQLLTAEGELHGYIVAQPRGSQGFGYNPLFCVEQSKKTLAEMGMEEKLSLDHRSLAFQALSQKLQSIL
ncbi:MAG TPA: RdgB/HAM1 family non-canonical purine NTP pyrophosphatase [Oligoflexia bacterium]|nr:RdgB/HAM1 family non-canonical purine NTP pyrophosphatase [Oligoflexia bacterium]HMR25740.1 RdgB/HAM1 family non-canonical purine NTP pyrophosphatase [Oligoflexia bacterium]